LDRGYYDFSIFADRLPFQFKLELGTYVNKLFPFARGIESFDSSPLTWEDYKNALGNLDVWIDDIYIDENMNLESFIKRVLERGNDIFA